MPTFARLVPLIAALAVLFIPIADLAAADPPAHDATTAVEADASHGDHGAGDPRLVPIPPSRDTIVSAVWVLVIFVVMLAILYPTAWKNVLAGLKAREQRIRQDIAEAEAARARADATLKEYNTRLATAEGQVREMIARATAEGEQVAAGIRTRAQQEAEETRERALRDIDAARDQAVAGIYEQAAVLSTSIAEKILRRNLNPDDQRDLVNRSLEQVQRIGKN